MTVDIVLVLFVLLASLVFFVTEWLRVDVVALLVLCALALLRLVSPEEAISGFSNAAVVTVWAMYIISEGLARAGIADQIGRQVMRVAGGSEARLIALLMLVAGSLSAFMNNVAVSALMLPVAMEAARRTGVAASRLLLPLAYGTMLGGLVTLVGTPPNLLVSTFLEDAGSVGFALFDFAYIGLPLLLVGTAFVVLIGRHLLPQNDVLGERRVQRELRAQYSLKERIFTLRLPPESLLAGKTIAHSGLISSAGLMILALTRDGNTEALPPRNTVLRPGDVLLAQGRSDRFELLRSWSSLSIERETPVLHEKLLAASALAELVVADSSTLAGAPLHHRSFRERFGVNLLAIRSAAGIKRTHVSETTVEAGDRLLVQGAPEAMAALHKAAEFDGIHALTLAELQSTYQLAQHLFVLRVPDQTPLIGTTFAENRLGDAFDFRLLGLLREGAILQAPSSEEVVQPGDLLLIQGQEEDLDRLRGLQQLERLEDTSRYQGLFEQGDLDLVEATLHPRSSLMQHTVADLRLPERYQVELAAIWRQGRPYRSGLDAMILGPGDALLIVGPRRRLAALNRHDDLLILNPVREKPVDSRKAPVAAGVLALVLAAVMAGWLSIAVAAVTGATLMVLTRCLTMEQAHRAIDWRAIFLIAGMLPLGLAMRNTGAAAWLADGVVSLLGPLGPWSVIAGVYLVTALGALLMPVVALVLIMAPIAITVSAALAISPHAMMMVVAVAATGLASPVSHPTNMMVMGPGGYRFVDYLKLGLPLTLVVFAVSALLLPLVWPL